MVPRLTHLQGHRSHLGLPYQLQEGSHHKWTDSQQSHPGESCQWGAPSPQTRPPKQREENAGQGLEEQGLVQERRVHHNSVCVPTPGSQLDRQLQTAEAKDVQGCKMRIRVVERAGTNLLTKLQSMDPSPMLPCSNITFFLPCTSSNLGTYRANTVVLPGDLCSLWPPSGGSLSLCTIHSNPAHPRPKSPRPGSSSTLGKQVEICAQGGRCMTG